jgi:hypothetical protein
MMPESDLVIIVASGHLYLRLTALTESRLAANGSISHLPKQRGGGEAAPAGEQVTVVPARGG